MTQLCPIAQLNQLGASAFANAVRPLFETAAPLATALHAQRPFASYAELIERAESVAGRLSLTDQIEVVNAHPRIGERAETVKRTSPLSYREQGYDQESSLPDEDVRTLYDDLARLNQAYEQRFGFRFMVFVNGRSKSEILAVLRERLHNSRDAELGTCLRAMFSIAHDRLAVMSREG